MEENFQLLIKTYENFKQIIVNDKYQTIDKIVHFIISSQNINTKDSEILSFSHGFYSNFIGESINLTSEVKTLLKLKLSFILNMIDGKEIEAETIIILLIETHKYFNEKLILFNQEIHNLSKELH